MLLLAVWLVAVAAPAASPASVPPASSPGPAAAPVPSPSADALAYDDAAVHFRPPDGWVRVRLGAPEAAGSGGPNDKAPPAAIYVFHAGKQDQRTIVLDIQPFTGTLDGFVSSHTTELRNAADGTFVDKQAKTTLVNGMPAYFLKVTQPGGQAGNQLRRLDYVTYDLRRSISAAYIGRFGDFDDDEAKKALSSLYVVVYPQGRQ